MLIREWTKSELAAYINTTSSIHTYESQHPGPDLTRDFVDELGEIVGGEWANGEGKERVVWPLTLMLMKKKG